MKQMAKAYKEIYEIFKYIPKQDVKKVPNTFIKFIEENMDKEYEYKVNHIRDFEKQEMLEETRVILAILYRDYWVTAERKKQIIEKQNKEIMELEQQKRKKYGVGNIFKKEQKHKVDMKRPIELSDHQNNLINWIIDIIKKR